LMRCLMGPTLSGMPSGGFGGSIDGMADRTIRLTAAVTPDDGWYVARCLEVEVASQGRTIDEALANLREALELYFEDEPVPETSEAIVAPVEVKLSA
jgi:predicted RNase H-like HicB family nuclease